MFTKFKLFIFSEDPDKLLPFYRDVLGMKVTGDLKLPRDYGYGLEVAPGYGLWIGQHSEVHGRSTEKYRTMLNLYTDDVPAAYEKVKDVEGVEIMQEPISMGEFNPAVTTRDLFTFTDPDGNAIQIMNP